MATPQDPDVRMTAVSSFASSLGGDDDGLLLGCPFVMNWDGCQYPVRKLDEYTCQIEASTVAADFDADDAFVVHQGEMVAEGETIEVDFRVRRSAGDFVTLGFHDLPITKREKLTRLWQEGMGHDRDELHGLSYDDLARGGSSEKNLRHAVGPKPASTLKKLVAITMLAAVMVLVFGWVVYVVQSRSTVAVSNSVINGNYLPVNSPKEGQLTEILVKPGAEVRQGDVLARLSNDDAETNLALVRSKLMRARAEAKAYREEAAKVVAMFAFTREKVQRDLKVAQATFAGSQAEVQAAQAQLSRLQPLIDRGNVPIADVDEAKAMLALANADQMRQSAVIETLRFAQEAAKQNVMVSENGAFDPLSAVNTKIALADAAVEELAQTEVVLEKLALPIELHSPSDGTIYAIYRGEGETLQVADQTLAVSANEGGWATGNVAAHMAPEIRPGHPVEVEIPSLGFITTGIVEAIGHRAVYGHGGYNADFRAGPLEVPIRVAIDLKGQAVPSGLRLHMTVRLRDHLKEVKGWVNEKIATHWYQQPPASDSDDPVKMSPKDSDSSSDVHVALSR